jgi:hypothetical protein
MTMSDYITRLTGPAGISEHLNYEHGWGPTNQGESLYETAAALFKLSASNFELRCEDGTVIDNEISPIQCMTGVATIVGTTQLGRKTLAEHAKATLKTRKRATITERSPEMEEISKLYEASTLQDLPLKLYGGKVTVHIKLSDAGLYNGVAYFFERYNLIPDVDFRLQCSNGYILDPYEGLPTHCKELTFLANSKYGERVEGLYGKGYLKAMEKRPTPRRRGASAAGWRGSMSSAESERMTARKARIREKIEEQKLTASLSGLSMGGRKKHKRTLKQRSQTPKRSRSSRQQSRR